MARRTTKPAAYQMPRMQITADELPGVIIFRFASLTDGSLDPEIKAAQALAEFKLDRCEWGLRAALQECCFLDWEIDEVVATGNLPGIGLGWTPAMALEAAAATADTSLADLQALSAAVSRPARPRALAA